MTHIDSESFSVASDSPFVICEDEEEPTRTIIVDRLKKRLHRTVFHPDHSRSFPKKSLQLAGYQRRKKKPTWSITLG